MFLTGGDIINNVDSSKHSTIHLHNCSIILPPSLLDLLVSCAYTEEDHNHFNNSCIIIYSLILDIAAGTNLQYTQPI